MQPDFILAWVWFSWTVLAQASGVVPATPPLVPGMPTLPPSAVCCWGQNWQHEENPPRLSGPSMGSRLSWKCACLACTRSGGKEAASRVFFSKEPSKYLEKLSTEDQIYPENNFTDFWKRWVQFSTPHSPTAQNQV